MSLQVILLIVSSVVLFSLFFLAFAQDFIDSINIHFIPSEFTALLGTICFFSSLACVAFAYYSYRQDNYQFVKSHCSVEIEKSDRYSNCMLNCIPHSRYERCVEGCEMLLCDGDWIGSHYEEKQ